MYAKIPTLIPIDVTEDVVESVTRKISGSSVPGGTDYEALHGWLLKFGEDSKKISTSSDNFIDWLANHNPPTAACCAYFRTADSAR